MDNLLGPSVTDADRALRCVLRVCVGECPSDKEGLEVFQEALLLSGVELADPDLSTGVGGVLTMTGAGFSSVDGVRGRMSVSIFGCTLVRRSGEAILAAAGGSRIGGSSGGPESAIVVGCCCCCCCCLPTSEDGRWSLEGRRSGLVLLLDAADFLDLNIPFILTPGDGDRRVGLCGGSKPVLLRPRRDSLDSTESDRWLGNVDALDALSLESMSVI